MRPIEIKGPEDLAPFLDITIDPARQAWLVSMRIPRAVVEGGITSLRQANMVPSEILLPGMLARSIAMLVKWGVERPHLSNKPGYFPVQRTFSRSTTDWFMDEKNRLLDTRFPDLFVFRRMMEKMRREGVTFQVEVVDKSWLQ